MRFRKNLVVFGMALFFAAALPGPALAASFQGLGDLAGGGFSSRAWGVSADGSTVVGLGLSASGNEAFRWTSSGGMWSAWATCPAGA